VAARLGCHRVTAALELYRCSRDEYRWQLEMLLMRWLFGGETLMNEQRSGLLINPTSRRSATRAYARTVLSRRALSDSVSADILDGNIDRDFFSTA